MASVEFIEKRLNGAKANLVKLEKKLERVLKAEESNYEKNNPYYYSEYDKRCTLRDIEGTKKDIEKYEQQLQTTIEKDNSRNVKVILDFLDEWKKRVYEFYDSENSIPPACFNRKGAIHEPYDFRVKYQTIRDYGWSITLTFDLLNE